MGIEPTQDFVGPTTVLKTGGITRYLTPPHAAISPSDDMHLR